MIAYPFSGIISNDKLNYIDIDHSDIRFLITRYCAYCGVTSKELRVRPCGTYIKVYMGAHVDAMRMALSYFIRDRFGLPYKLISELVGYNNHTTPIKNKPKIEGYIKNKDATFYPYWLKLLELQER